MVDTFLLDQTAVFGLYGFTESENPVVPGELGPFLIAYPALKGGGYHLSRLAR